MMKKLSVIVPVYNVEKYLDKCLDSLANQQKGVSNMAKEVKPSLIGELEITTLNQMYLENNSLNVEIFGRGYTWLDTGTMDSLAEACNFVRTIQNLQGVGISVIEEIAYKNGWIDKEQLLKSADSYGKSEYGKHLRKVAEERRYSDRKK